MIKIMLIESVISWLYILTWYILVLYINISILYDNIILISYAFICELIENNNNQ